MILGKRVQEGMSKDVLSLLMRHGVRMGLEG
jgi:hypothetical protein